MSGEAGPRRANTVFAFAVQGSTALFTAVLTLVLLRLLGSHAYGEFALALAIGSLVLLPADLGVSGSTARFVAEARGSREATTETLVAGIRLRLAISLAVSGGLFLLAGPIASAYGNGGLTWPIRGMALAVLGQGFMRFCLGSLSARERNSLSFLVVLGESFAETVASIALVAAGGGAAGAALGRAVGYAVGALLGAVVLARLFRLPLRALVRSPTRPATVRRIAGYAGMLAAVDGVWATFSQVDVLLIGAILDSTAAGIFQAPLRLLAVASYPGVALGAAVGPRLARTGAREAVDAGPLVRSAQALLLPQAFVASVVIAWAVPITRAVLGPGYSASAAVFAALGPYIVLGGLAPMLSNAIDYVGGTRRRLRVAALALATNVALDLALLPTIGVVGGAVGTDAGYAVWVVGHLRVASDLLGFDLAPLGATALCCLAALVPTTGVLLLGARLGVPGFAVAALVAPASFLAVLHLTGETREQPWLRGLPVRARRRLLRTVAARDEVTAA